MSILVSDIVKDLAKRALDGRVVEDDDLVRFSGLWGFYSGARFGRRSGSLDKGFVVVLTADEKRLSFLDVTGTRHDVDSWHLLASLMDTDYVHVFTKKTLQ